MTHIITIETQSESQFAQIKGLAEQLGVRIKESHTKDDLGEAEALRLSNLITGNWTGDETGDERNAMIQGSQDQYQMFLQSEKLQKEYPPIRVSPDIDLSALANDVNL